MENKYTFLQPTYFNDFVCVGSVCNINCCNYNWKITIDKKTYQKYKISKISKEFDEKLNKYVKKNRSAKTDIDYAKIIRIKQPIQLKFSNVEDGKELEKVETVYNFGCIFQDENKLCEIYKNLGEEALSNTCKIYPRIVNNIFGNYERSFNTGCEEVSKLLYKQKDGISFEIIKTEEQKLNNYNINLKKENLKYVDYFDEVRAMCIRILQLNELNMDNRIILLGAFMFKTDELVKDNQFENISAYIDQFAENLAIYEPLLKIETIREDNFIEMFIKLGLFTTGIGGRADISFELQNIFAKFKKAYTKKLGYEITSIINENGEEVSSNNQKQEEEPLITLDNGSVISKDYKKYKENRDKLMEGKEYYVENLFTHIFFTKGYPYSKKHTIKECFLKFAWSYCYYKGLLAGYLGERKSLDEDMLHKICVVLGRTCVDQDISLNKILDNLKDNEVDNLAFLAVLIKSA